MKPGPQNPKTWRCKCGCYTVMRRVLCFRCGKPRSGLVRCERCEGTGFDGSGEPCAVCEDVAQKMAAL